MSKYELTPNGFFVGTYSKEEMDREKDLRDTERALAETHTKYVRTQYGLCCGVPTKLSIWVTNNI